jgi:putative DNA methylase
MRDAQQEVYDSVDRQITAWKIEHNEEGMRADAYLYCTETICPECGWLVPLAPSWVIGEKTRCVAKLVPEPSKKGFRIDIESGVSAEEMAPCQGIGHGGRFVPGLPQPQMLPEDAHRHNPRARQFWQRRRKGSAPVGKRRRDTPS